MCYYKYNTSKGKLLRKHVVISQPLKQYRKLFLLSTGCGLINTRVYLAVGCRVMLRHNIDVTVGLVNVAIGTVMGIYLHVYQLNLITLMS